MRKPGFRLPPPPPPLTGVRPPRRSPHTRRLRPCRALMREPRSSSGALLFMAYCSYNYSVEARMTPALPYGKTT